MNRIDEKFQLLKEKNEKAMISFVTAGDPDLDTTVDLVIAMEKSGADIIELGIPYSDPLADGVTIQQSSTRALKNGAKIAKIMDSVEEIRKKSQVPLVYLVYYNSIFKYGMEKFIGECSDVGIDAVIIPDLPIEERKDIIDVADKYGVYLIPLVAPTSKDRIKAITEDGKGFVYCVSTTGVTGVRQAISTNIEEYMNIVSQYTKMPKALGFGISSAEMAKEFKPYCDAIIVGSAIVKKVAEGKNKEEIIEKVSNFVSGIKDVLKS
ncbi:tryptophan synthase subunit alpha [Clostridium magnum]|uniref:Tryptophan synthase alpha chain n=1 Tax=Clostridium magnum DSM 2767 TaxID=1121326 RepID=A0A162S4F2_9CLOT|nr:tryptophan synthase subunit alpha [Clostridium magnum]KZL90759.1 tryptophan synthase alpha chain [Clostridium magnum DSM 2767]SHJ47672.1 tryptophan synthase, alpha chain [Clostridium magnum DSM 2767]